MKKAISYLALALVMAGLCLGCRGDRDKGINKDKDKPKPAATK